MQIHHASVVYTARCFPIGYGAKSIKKTTKMMADLVREYENDPNLIARARSIVQLCQPKDYPCEVRALFDFVSYQIRYVNDVVDKETLTTPDVTLAMRSGDCDDKSVLLAVLLRAIGYRVKFIVTGYTAPDVYEHVFVQAEVNGEPWDLDTTERMPMGWSPADPIAYYEQPIV